MTEDPMDQHKARNYGMSLSNEVNMTNCYKHCEHFFKDGKIIHFNVRIAYWMMAGYLGPIDSVEEAYIRGHEILLDLTYKKGILKPYDEDPEMIEFVTSANSDPTPTDSEPILCSKHKRFCNTENLGFVDLLDLVKLGDFVVLTDGMLRSDSKIIEDQSVVSNRKKLEESLLLIDGNHLSRQVFHYPRKLRYLGYFKPRPNSLDLLLKNVRRRLSVLLLRDCELLRKIDISLEKFENLRVLEISGLCHADVTSIPLDEISQLTQLQCLNLSDLLIENFPDHFFNKLEELRWVILRGCYKLVSLPTIKHLKKLKMLDLSHCYALKKFAAAVLQNSPVQMLDLSYTSMKTIPTLKDTPNLTHLFVRNAKVAVLSSLKQVSSLEVLDLSGAESVIEIKQLVGNKNLKLLDLSKTKITSIDFLSDFIHLRDLILQECVNLTKLPPVDKLTKLEVLDISGCKSFSELPEGLCNLKSLKELNLSVTKVNHLPPFPSLTSLRKLSLKGLQLASLETVASLSSLVELDLTSLEISSSQKFIFDPQSLKNLEILNLSHTSVAQLPNLSKLENLRKLILANCEHLEAVSDLQALTNLETLDLSLPERLTINNCQVETEIEGQGVFCLSVPTSLRQLVLKNRSGVQKLFPMTSHDKLETLDLCGTDVKDIPCEIVAQVNCIQLPAKIGLSRVRLRRIGDLQEAIGRKDNLQWQYSDVTDIKIVSAIGKKSSMSAGPNQFFHLKEDDQGSWEAFIHHFPISLPTKENKEQVIYLDEDEFILRGDLSWARRLLNVELKGRSVEILGFSELADKIRNVLELADNIALVGNDFLLNWADDVASGINKVPGKSFRIFSKVLRVCCIRRCSNMETVLGEEKNGIIAVCLERLVLSHLVNLKSICAKKVSSKSIVSLKHIHIDCCPNLEKVIIPSQVPENLETLHVKFCDKLQIVFEENVSLSNLQKLSLFELPNLECIEAKLPKLETLSIGQCPKLKNLDKLIEFASTSLTQVFLDSCPALDHVFPSSVRLEQLRVLKISSCSGLVNLFDNSGSSSSSLHNLQILRLWNLPKLKSIGGELNLVSAPDLDPSLPPSYRQQLNFPGQ